MMRKCNEPVIGSSVVKRLLSGSSLTADKSEEVFEVSSKINELEEDSTDGFHAAMSFF